MFIKLYEKAVYGSKCSVINYYRFSVLFQSLQPQNYNPEPPSLNLFGFTLPYTTS